MNDKKDVAWISLTYFDHFALLILCKYDDLSVRVVDRVCMSVTKCSAILNPVVVVTLKCKCIPVELILFHRTSLRSLWISSIGYFYRRLYFNVLRSHLVNLHKAIKVMSHWYQLFTTWNVYLILMFGLFSSLLPHNCRGLSFAAVFRIENRSLGL